MYRPSAPPTQNAPASTTVSAPFSPNNQKGFPRKDYPLTPESIRSSSSNTDNPAFDSLVSTPENIPPSPSAFGDIGDTSCSSSSARSRMGSFERPSFVQSSVPDSYFYSARPNCLNDPAGQINPLFSEGQDDLDEMLLTKYRNQLMPLHPFVLIPDHVQAAMLKAHRPFLMLAIRMVAGFESLQSMRGQIQQVMDYLADRMFRQAERSLDLLMGIVVVLGWYHYHCMKHSQLNNLLCLAESLVSDLGLNRRPVGQMGERAMDEKRLLLGVWYLRSSYVNPPPPSPPSWLTLSTISNTAGSQCGHVSSTTHFDAFHFLHATMPSRRSGGKGARLGLCRRVLSQDSISHRTRCCPYEPTGRTGAASSRANCCHDIFQRIPRQDCQGHARDFEKQP